MAIYTHIVKLHTVVTTVLVLTVAQYNQYITLHLACVICLTAVVLIPKIAVSAKQLMCAEQPSNQTSWCIIQIQ